MIHTAKCRLNDRRLQPRASLRLLVIASAVITLLGPALHAVAEESAQEGFDHSHAGLEEVLQTYLHDGLVNYRGLKANRSGLDSYLQGLGAVTPSEMSGWTRDQRLAFWINAYNGFTLKVIIDHYPIQSSFFGRLRFPANSIRQIDGVWDKLKWPVASQKLTLNHMEHQILRKEFDEPRVHAAINCASMGCPPLADHAFTAEGLEEKLHAAAKRFALERNVVDPRRKVVGLSKILSWFTTDFQQHIPRDPAFADLSSKEAAALSFLLPYLPEAQQNFLRAGDLDIEWLDYDWTLNETRRP